MQLIELQGHIEGHLGRELTTLQTLKLKDWYFLHEPTFYTDTVTGKLLWVNTKYDTYTLASLSFRVLDVSHRVI